MRSLLAGGNNKIVRSLLVAFNHGKIHWVRCLKLKKPCVFKPENPKIFWGRTPQTPLLRTPLDLILHLPLYHDMQGNVCPPGTVQRELTHKLRSMWKNVLQENGSQPLNINRLVEVLGSKAENWLFSTQNPCITQGKEDLANYS